MKRVNVMARHSKGDGGEGIKGFFGDAYFDGLRLRRLDLREVVELHLKNCRQVL